MYSSLKIDTDSRSTFRETAMFTKRQAVEHWCTTETALKMDEVRVCRSIEAEGSPLRW